MFGARPMPVNKPILTVASTLLLLLCNFGAAGLSTWKDAGSDFAAGTHSGTELDAGAVRLAMDSGSDRSWTKMDSIHPTPRSGHGMVFDSVNGVEVMYGGSYSNETWTYNMTTNLWTLKRPGLTPSACGSFAMAYDPSRGLTLLFGGGDSAASRFHETWTYNAATNVWTDMAPASSPPALSALSMVYDSGRGVFIMFGGMDGAKVWNETWAYSLATNTWTRLAVKNAPSPRYSYSMAYDASAGLTVLWGGVNSTFSGTLNETWTFDSRTNEWTERKTALSPGTRNGCPMVYDSLSRLCVAFSLADNQVWRFTTGNHSWTPVENTAGAVLPAGTAQAFDPRYGITVMFGSGNPTDELWTYSTSLDRWAVIPATRAPTPRTDHSMVYDSVHQLTVMFGGNSTRMRTLSDTWTYDSLADVWKNVTPGACPPARANHAMAFDPRGGNVILFGGSGASNEPLNDTWAYNASVNSWLNREPAGPPPARRGHSMSYDGSTGLIVLHGGAAGGLLNDTWVYNSSANTWTQITPALSPPPRNEFAMDYDPGARLTILFGGYLGGKPSSSNDTWAFDSRNNTWTNLTPPATWPFPISSHAMVYSAALGGLLFFSGFESYVSGVHNNTWLYTYANNTWTRLYPPAWPPWRYGHAMAYDSVTGAVIVNGGRTALTTESDTWCFGLRGRVLAGTYTSRPYDTGGGAYFGSLAWDADLSPNTSIRFQLRSSESLAGLNTSKFTGPDGSSQSYFTSTGTRIPSLHNGTRWLQYRAYLSTTSTRETPVLRSVSIRYNLIQSLIVTSPGPGDEWNGSGFHEIKWNATDRDGDALVYDVYATNGGTVNITLAQSRPSDKLAWMTNATPNGRYRILVVARDTNPEIPLTVYGYSGEFGVANELPVPPSCRIFSPSEGQELRGLGDINGNATKGSKDLEHVELRMDGGMWYNATGTDNWTSQLDTTLLAKGRHTIEARAFDGNLYSANAIVNVTVNNSKPPRVPELVTAGEFPICLIITLLAIITEGFVAAKDQQNKRREAREKVARQAGPTPAAGIVPTGRVTRRR